MATDKNVTIVSLDLSQVYYFPGCVVYRHLDKDITVIPLPTETMGLDLLLAKDSVRITGRWEDDPDSDYDGLTPLKRMMNFWQQASIVGGRMIFRWTSGEDEEMLYIMVKTLDTSKASGEGKSMEYNFNFAVVNELIT